MVAAAAAVEAAAASLALLALGVAAFTGEAEALLLLAVDPSLFFLGDLICERRNEVWSKEYRSILASFKTRHLTGMETRSSLPKMSEFFFLFLAGSPRLLSSIPPPLLSLSLSSSSPPNRDLRPSADSGLAAEAQDTIKLYSK